MSLAIANATSNWQLSPQTLAGGHVQGEGGPNQSHAQSLVFFGTTANWGLLPLVPTIATLDPNFGNPQAYASSFLLFGTSVIWNITTPLVQPKITVQRGTGGPTQPPALSLIVLSASANWTLAARLLRASFTHTFAPDGFAVQFTSTSGGNPDAFQWDFGDGEAGGGQTVTHVYGAVQSFTVTLTVSRVRGFESTPLAATVSAVVTIAATAQPDETVDDVLNLEVGHHAYEPLRNQDSDIGENVGFYNSVVNLPAGQLASLLFYVPARTIRVRQVTATGTGDGLFKLILNGQILDVKRSYATQRNVRFDLEDELKLTATDVLEVLVTNTSQNRQSYDGALLGRTL